MKRRLALTAALRFTAEMLNAETRRRGEEEKKEDKHAPPRTGRREKIIRPLLCLLRDLGGQSISLCEIFAICG
jgi:hypothetical protein